MGTNISEIRIEKSKFFVHENVVCEMAAILSGWGDELKNMGEQQSTTNPWADFAGYVVNKQSVEIANGEPHLDMAKWRVELYFRHTRLCCGLLELVVLSNKLSLTWV